VGVGALMAAGWIGIHRWVRRTIAGAREEMARGHFTEALSWLERISRWGLSGGEVEFLIGHCEQSARRPKAALDAWSRVPAGCAFAPAAAVSRGALLIRLGRFAEAESVLAAALRDPGGQAAEIRRHLIALLEVQGRRREAWPLAEADCLMMSKPGWP